MLSLNSQRKLKKKINEKTSLINKIMKEHMEYENIEAIPDGEIKDMRKIVGHKIGLEAFYLAYEGYLNKGENDKLRAYAGEIVDYKVLLNNKIVRYKYRKSYILYLISQFQINTKEVGDFAIESLENESMYVRNNALRVIRNTGNVDLFLKTIKIITEKNYYYNYRVLADFIDNFNGDMEKLDKALLENIDNFNSRFKRLTIEHFANEKNSQEDVKLMVLDLLRGSQDKEVLIVATRYFGRIIDKRSKTYIIENLKSKD